MVRIDNIVRKVRSRGQNGEKEKVKNNQKNIEDRLREMYREMIKEYENRNIFNAAFIADRIRMLAESENIYPADVNWRLVEELSKILERNKIGVL